MIRSAQPHDLQAVFGLARQLATAFIVDEHAFHAAFASVLYAPGVHLAVTKVDGQIVGYVLAFRHVTAVANLFAGAR